MLPDYSVTHVPGLYRRSRETTMRSGRTLAIATLFFVAHFAATITLLFRHLGNEMSFSETLPPPPPSSRLLEVAVAVLTFPILHLPSGVVPKLNGWLLLPMNSLLWTAVLAGAVHFLRQLFRRFGPSQRVRN